VQRRLALHEWKRAQRRAVEVQHVERD
jgi:hypothetical protein